MFFIFKYMLLILFIQLWLLAVNHSGIVHHWLPGPKGRANNFC